jgi:hypothetical protein
MREFPEADWRVFRRVREAALERYCDHILSEVVRVSSDSSKSSHERYLAIWGLLEKHDKQLSNAFNNPKRSQAFEQLVTMRSLGLLDDRELRQFSPGTRDLIGVLFGSAR